MKNSKISVSINHSNKIILINTAKIFKNNIEVYNIINPTYYSDTTTLTKVINELSQSFSNYDFWWYEWGELSVKLWDSDFFKILKNIFSKLNLIDKLFFIDNNLGTSNYSHWNYIGAPTMLGFTYNHKFDISERRFEKKFLSLNRISKPHRELIRDLIVDKCLDNTFFSYAPNDLNNPKRIVLDEVDDTKFGNMKHSYTSEYQLLSFCNIITETFYINGPIHITEKVDKCFSAGQPFILLAGIGYIKKLQELGFKTFNKWWDESYDDISDLNKKVSKIGEVIDLVNSWSLKKCEEVYLEMIPILKHNQELCGKYSNSIYHLKNFNKEMLQINSDKLI